VSVCSGRAGLEPLHHRVCGGGAHGWKRQRCGTLLGPEGTAPRGLLFGSGFRPGPTSPAPVFGWSGLVVPVGVWGSVGCL
jgi:hypothetical protein